MPVLVGRGHGEFIMGGAGAPELINKTVHLGGSPTGYIHGNGRLVETAAPVMNGQNGGKRKSRTVRRKKRRRTKHKTASRSRTGRRHKKHSKKHPQTRRRKPRSRRRKRRVKVHKQEGKGVYTVDLANSGIVEGTRASYAPVSPDSSC